MCISSYTVLDLFVCFKGIFFAHKLERIIVFDLFKRRREKFVLTAPVSGKLIELSNVSDPVFAKKMLGDGLAIKPDNNSSQVMVEAPVSGKIVSLPDTKHAFGIETEDGKQILVHIGIDTVNLKGKGFKAYAKQGDMVKHGDKIISFNSKTIKNHKLDDTVMIIFTRGYEKKIEPQVEYGTEIEINQAILS